MAQENKPPATQPAGPKQVSLALAKAIEQGDANAAKGVVVAEQAKLIEQTVTLAAALRKLDGAAAGRFNQAGVSVTQNGLRMGEAFKSLEAAVEKVEGETATLLAGDVIVMRLTKVERQWRVRLAAPAERMDRTVAYYQALIDAASRTAAEVEAGEIKSVSEAGAVFSRRAFSARVGAE